MTTTSTALATNLQQARGAMGLTLRKMALYLGLKSGEAYRNYESGRIPRDMAVVEQIANKLGVTVGALLSDPQAVASVKVADRRRKLCEATVARAALIAPPGETAAAPLISATGPTLAAANGFGELAEALGEVAAQIGQARAPLMRGMLIENAATVVEQLRHKQKGET